MMSEPEDEEILAKLRMVLAESPAWQPGGYLELACEWQPLCTATKRSPHTIGVYALGLPVTLMYDGGSSAIIYLGSAKNLHTRLTTHRRQPRNRVVDSLQMAFPDGLRVTWWPLPELDTEFLRAIEGEAIWTFERTFGAVPLGNLDIPESFWASHYCEGLTRIAPEETDEVLTLDQLAERLKKEAVRTERKLYSAGITIVFEGAPVHDSYRSVELLTPEEIASRKENEQRSPYEWTDADEKQRMIDALSIVHPVNVAAWTPEKIAAILRTCSELLTLRTTKSQIVRQYVTGNRNVPQPHTWGEIALVQARLLAGSWLPSERIWVKVLYGRELLAEAKFNKGWCYGQEWTDLPQTSNRPEWHPPEIQPEEYLPNDFVREVVYGVEIERVKPDANKRIEQEVQRGLEKKQQLLYARIERIFRKGMELVSK